MISRHSHNSKFSPATIRETRNVPVALDNLVCGVCSRPLGDVKWTIVSSPKRKGIIVFSCAECISGAMNLLAKAIDGLSTVPDNLKLPNGENN